MGGWILGGWRVAGGRGTECTYEIDPVNAVEDE